jgi:hypothetical protein
MFRERVRKENHIRWWRQQNHTICLQAIAHGERHSCTTQRMTDQSVGGSNRVSDCTKRPRELWQRSLIAVGCAMSRSIEEDDPKAATGKRESQAAEPAGPAAPAVSQNDDRSAAPAPDGEILVLTPYGLPAASGEKRLFSFTQLIAGRPAKDGFRPTGSNTGRNRPDCAKSGSKHPERRRGSHYLSM